MSILLEIARKIKALGEPSEASPSKKAKPRNSPASGHRVSAVKEPKLLASDHPWFRGKEFTADWVSNKLDLWKPHIEQLSGRSPNILEVGTYEGRSAIAFLEMLPDSKITCIDHFTTPGVEERFDRNLASYAGRVIKHKGNAIQKMDSLVAKARQYDLVYFDAAKDRTGAFVVSALGWHLCRVGGLMIWDDLSWQKSRKPSMRPEPGSRLFIQTFSSCLDVKFNAHQCIAWKTADWPRVDSPAAP